MNQHASTISELESGIQRSLSALRELDERGELHEELRPLLALAPPDGASVHVSLRQRDTGRALRGGAATGAWWPQHCGAWVVYEAAESLRSLAGRDQRSADGSGEPLRDFITALDRVEKDPHLHFVSLKWFRDTYLTKRGYEWATDPDLPRRMIHEAAEGGMILTSKVPNPKTPEFPVTTIQLNRSHPEVRRILDSIGASAPDASRVRPASIQSMGDAGSDAAVQGTTSRSGAENPRDKPVDA